MQETNTNTFMMEKPKGEFCEDKIDFADCSPQIV